MVSVPPAPARERIRGYDMAYILGRLVTRAAPWSQVAPIIERADGPRQVGRPRNERLADPPRVRLLSEKVRLPSDDLWLIDDVVTTGGTLGACAAALQAAGCREIAAVAFARTLGR